MRSGQIETVAEVCDGRWHYTVEQSCSCRPRCHHFISNIEAAKSSERAVRTDMTTTTTDDGHGHGHDHGRWMDRVHSWSSKCSPFDYRLDPSKTPSRSRRLRHRSPRATLHPRPAAFHSSSSHRKIAYRQHHCGVRVDRPPLRDKSCTASLVAIYYTRRTKRLVNQNIQATTSA